MNPYNPDASRRDGAATGQGQEHVMKAGVRVSVEQVLMDGHMQQRAMFVPVDEDMSWGDAAAWALALAADDLPRTVCVLARAAVLHDETGEASEARLLGDAYAKFIRAASDYCAAWDRLGDGCGAKTKEENPCSRD